MKLQTAAGEVLLRPFEERDIPTQMDYIYGSSVEYLKSIGFEPAKFPGREAHSLRLRKDLRDPASPHKTIVAVLDGRPIAVVGLQKRPPPEIPNGHFHIYDSALRGQGLGAPILKAGLRLLMDTHGVQRLYIEPKHDNLPMNRLMLKCGFKLLGQAEYEGQSTSKFTANRYEVLLEQL